MVFCKLNTFVMLASVCYIYVDRKVDSVTVALLQVVWTSISIVTFMFSAVLVWVERHYQLPTVAGRGHGLVLLLFWTFLFAFENLTFVNLNQNDWWFHPTTQVKHDNFLTIILGQGCCFKLKIVHFAIQALIIRLLIKNCALELLTIQDNLVCLLSYLQKNSV